MTRPPTNLAASVRARLLAKAQALGENFTFVLRRYGVECVLRRLARSRHADKFVLKGATLFVVWTGRIHRPTRDLDLLGVGLSDPAALREVFGELCQTACQDGIDFSGAEVTAEPINEDGHYRGVRLRFVGELDRARIPVQVDVGVGDAVVPAPETVEFPSLIGLPAIVIKAYPREAMVAEKLHAIVALGDGNSRMKDFHDLVEVSETWPFDGRTLSRAIAATFGRRGMEVFGTSPPPAPFFADPERSSRWRAFHRKLDSPTVPAEFGEVGERVRRFLEPVLDEVTREGMFDKRWRPGGPWQ